MKENFDNKFSQKIKEVFENRQEPYNPKDWEKLKAKMAKDKDRHFFWYFNKSVAVVILFIMIGGTGGIMLYRNFQNTATPIGTNKKINIKKTDTINKLDKIISDSIHQDSVILPIYNPYIKDAESIIEGNKNNITNIGEKNDKIETAKDVNSDILLQDLKKTENYIADSKPENVTKENTADLEKANSNNYLQNTANIALDLKNKESLMANLNTLTPSDSIAKKDINSVLEILDEKAPENNKVTFGIAVTSLVNYSQTNQNANVSIGGGVLMDVPILKNLDISTGLLVTNQKINFQENAVEATITDTQLKSKEAILTGLDIPINLKYNFSLNKNNMFIAVGLSSVTYLKENVESTYQYRNSVFTESVDVFGNTTLVSKTVSVLEKETESMGSFNNFHFGEIMNFSFGVELPLNQSRQSLIVEPYFKYSLKPLTSENINFSTAGINLKLNFNTRKKLKQ